MNTPLTFWVATGEPGALGWTLAAVAVVIVGIAKSGFGGGVGIVAVPLFVLAMGARHGLGALLPLLIAADILSVHHHWATWDGRNLRVLMPGTLVGIALGAALMTWMLSANTDGHNALGAAERNLKMAIGVLCTAYVVGDLVRRRFAPHWRLRATWFSGSVIGLTAGVTSTLAHAAGPVVASFLLGQHLPKQRFIGTAVTFFFMVNLIKLLPYGWLAMIDTSTLWHGVWLLPLVPVGTLLGARLNRVMSETLFRFVIMAIVLLTGVKLIIG